MLPDNKSISVLALCCQMFLPKCIAHLDASGRALYVPLLTREKLANQHATYVRRTSHAGQSEASARTIDCRREVLSKNNRRTLCYQHF